MKRNLSNLNAQHVDVLRNTTAARQRAQKLEAELAELKRGIAAMRAFYAGNDPHTVVRCDRVARDLERLECGK